MRYLIVILLFVSCRSVQRTQVGEAHITSLHTESRSASLAFDSTRLRTLNYTIEVVEVFDTSQRIVQRTTRARAHVSDSTATRSTIATSEHVADSVAVQSSYSIQEAKQPVPFLPSWLPLLLVPIALFLYLKYVRK